MILQQPNMFQQLAGMRRPFSPVMPMARAPLMPTRAPINSAMLQAPIRQPMNPMPVPQNALRRMAGAF